MSVRIVFALALLLLAQPLLQAPATAQEGSAPPEATRLTLSETATREVEQDTIVATLMARAEGETATAVQAAVNGTMTEALETAGEVDDVRPATGSYRVYQRFDPDRGPVAWIAEQELRLEGGRPAPVLELVGSLQQGGLVLQALGFQLSEPARREVEDELTIEAIQRLRIRAEGIAAALEMTVARIEVLSVGGAPGISPPRPMFEARMAMAEAAPPAAVPDLQSVNVTVRAEIALHPK